MTQLRSFDVNITCNRLLCCRSWCSARANLIKGDTCDEQFLNGESRSLFNFDFVGPQHLAELSFPLVIVGSEFQINRVLENIGDEEVVLLGLARLNSSIFTSGARFGHFRAKVFPIPEHRQDLFR